MVKPNPILLNSKHKETIRLFFSTEKEYLKYNDLYKEGDVIAKATVQYALNYYTNSPLSIAIRKKAKQLLLNESKKPAAIKK